jgi:O-antigen/teichoic acid export membrane protein
LLKGILLLICSIIIGTIITVQIRNGIISNSESQIKILIILFISTLFQSINTLYDSFFQAQMLIAKKQTSIVLGKIIQSIYSLIVVFALENFIFYVFGILLGQIITLILNISFSKVRKLSKINVKLLVEYLSFGFFTIIPLIIQIIIKNLGPLYFLKYYDETLLGVYYVIINTLYIFKMIENSFNLMLFPSLSSHLQKNDFESIRSEIKEFEKYMSIVSSMIIISGFIAGPMLIKLLLGEFYYLNGINVFYGSIVFMVGSAIFGPYSALIFVSGKLKIYLLYNLVTIILVVICWYFLIPTLNIFAIDLGRWIALIPNLIIVRGYCYKKFKLGGFQLKNVITFSFTLIFSIIGYILSLYLENNVFPIIISTGILLGIYICLLYISKVITNKDIRFLIATINPKIFLKQFKDEFKNEQ